MSRRHDDDATTIRSIFGEPDDGIGARLLPALDDRPGPARRIPSAKAAAMASSIVDAALAAGPLSDPFEKVAPPRMASGTASDSAVRAAERALPVVTPAPQRRPRTVALLAAAIVLAATVGAAAAVLVTRQLGPVAPAAPPMKVEPAPVKPKPRAPAVEQTEPAAIEMPAEPAEIEMDPTHIRRPSRAERVLPEDAPAEDVLALANQRRKDQDWRGADELYRRVVRRFPRTDAAVVAEIASATLHLSHLRDPSGALRSYRHALKTRPRGPLAEEARWGIAEAHRATGDRDAERDALSDFLSAHPDSALAPAARRRQAELAP